ncbi:hypothetical protein LH128_29310, partial [Sphingomonas sp. LH128]|uniref:hypothetical protein n=1 Tax=Sphingomonas sp. LH128 TaxID=473781 RepID=UPI00027CA49A
CTCGPAIALIGKRSGHLPQDRPHRDQETITPAGGHEGGKPKNFRYIVGGIIVIFLLGMAIVGASTKVLQRPGPDQGATEKAPAD